MPVYRRKKDRKARMPPTRYTPPKKTRRQAYSKSRVLISGTNPSNSLVHRGIGFPDRFTTNLVYSDSFILDPSATTICPFKSYKYNSPYDPDLSLGGGQPTYFDQIALIYNRYMVTGAKVTAIFSRGTTSTGNVGPYVVGIHNNRTATLPTTSGGVLMSVPDTTTAVYSMENGTTTVVGTYSQQNVFPDQLDSVQSVVTSNPSNVWFANVFATPQGVDVETPINVLLLIEYHVQFSELKSIVDA